MPLGTRAQTRKKRDREEEDDDAREKPPEFKRHNSKNSEVENLEDQAIEERPILEQEVLTEDGQRDQQPSSSRQMHPAQNDSSDMSLRSSLFSVNQPPFSQRARNEANGDEEEEQTGNRKEFALSKFQAILNADGHRLKIEEAVPRLKDEDGTLKPFNVLKTIKIKCLKCEQEFENTDKLAQHYLADHANQEQKDFVALYQCFEREMWQDLERAINNQRMETSVIKQFVVNKKFVLHIPFDSDIVPYVLPTETKVYLHSCPNVTKYFFQVALQRNAEAVQVFFVFDDHLKTQKKSGEARASNILEIFQEVEGYSAEQLIALPQDDRRCLIDLLEGESGKKLKKEKKEFIRNLLSRLKDLGNAKRMTPVQIKEAVRNGARGFKEQKIPPIDMRKNQNMKQTANPVAEPTANSEAEQTANAGAEPTETPGQKAKPANQKKAKPNATKVTKAAPKRDNSGPQKKNASTKKSKK